MNDRATRSNKHRQDLVDRLTDSIMDAVDPLMGPEVGKGEKKKAASEINERLNFEVNVALNEIVTRLAAKPIVKEEKSPERTFERFGINFRMQHVLMFTSVILLIFTGIPLKFPEYGFAKFIIIDICGGLQNSSVIHRVGAIGLIIVGFWHLMYTFFSRMGRRDFWLMIPRPKDVRDAFQTIMYFIGRRSSGSKHGRFSFIEKFDYWAVYWGMVIMIGSGLVLWFKEIFPKYGYDIAREAHSDEGLLATLAIVIWHFYNVHLNPEVFPSSWVWWHGKLTESEMKHHHPLEYAEIIEKESAEIQQQHQAKREGVEE